MTAQGDRVAALYLAGKSPAEIVGEVGCSKHYVHKIRRARGIPPQHPRKIQIAAIQDDVASRYQAGESAAAISTALGLPVTSVYRALKKAGVARRHQPTPSELLEEAAPAIIAKYLAGRSMESIAADYDCSGGSVRNVLLRNGVGRRSSARRFVEFTPQEQAEIIQMRDSGARVLDISERFSRDPSVVNRFLKRVGRGGRVKQPKVIGSGGYIYVRDARGEYVLEHRHVMAQALGRPLDRTETVHHIDGDVTNNALHNLQLRQGKHGKGVAMECLDCGSHNVRPAPLRSP